MQVLGRRATFAPRCDFQEMPCPYTNIAAERAGIVSTGSRSVGTTCPRAAPRAGRRSRPGSCRCSRFPRRVRRLPRDRAGLRTARAAEPRSPRPSKREVAPMTKADLVEQIATETGVSKNHTALIVDSLLDA